MLLFAEKVRFLIARQPDTELSDFLTNVVLKGGVFIGLAQLAFLIFSAIQCEGEVDKLGKCRKWDENHKEYEVPCDWRQCNRTLYAQTGLGMMVAVYVGVKIVSGLAPKRLLNKHTVQANKIVAMDLNWQEKIQVFGLSVTVGCGMFLLGFYGAKGSYYNQFEKILLIVLGILGSSSLLITSFWTFIIIRGEMKREAESEQEISIVADVEDKHLTEASSLFFYLGVLATSVHTPTKKEEPGTYVET
ncbi:hypothetical protein TL16_g11064 [Triparma laevis f. inornata]|uniref:Uncharacterized protein n=2 Tax=Triparma laevis TaxID=1534972 RepID=A0A9W7C3E4_9STRA|nr:hypothetical protein TL16_g11064 [Triparma laevis f. inornata]GMI02537.1 hypothetical protein TrLO_g8525 [Triparma laevis f. longispina]